MKKKDKIKTIIALCLFVLVVGSFLIFGKESIVMKYVSGAALIIWLAAMFLLNKKN